MMKILYILPVLAVLGMISSVDASADQERIDELEAKIDKLEAKIDRFEAKIDRLDPATDQKRIDKLEAKIDKLEAKIDRFEAQIERLEARDTDGDTTEKDTGDTTETQRERYSRGTMNTATLHQADPPVSAQQAVDNEKPTFDSARYDTDTGVLTIRFSELIDFSEVLLDDMYVFDVNDRLEIYLSLVDAEFDRSSDSDTMTLTLHEAYQNAIGWLDVPKLGFEAGSVRDVAGNTIDAATDQPIAIFPVPPPPVIPDPQVTIANDRFDANVRTIELESGTGEFTVEFVNNNGGEHTLLIDLLSGGSSHSRDVPIGPGDTRELTFNVSSMGSGDTVYLLYGVSGGSITGDTFITVSMK